MTTYQVEIDWPSGAVHRATFEAPEGATRALLVRRGKVAAGMRGRKHINCEFGDGIEILFVDAMALAYIIEGGMQA